MSRKLQAVNAISDDGICKFYFAKDNQIFISDTLLNITNTLTIDSTIYKINALTKKDSSIYITGYYDPFNNGYVQMFVAKLDSLGKFVWSKIGVSEKYGSSKGNAILVDRDNNICIAGYYRNVVSFDSITAGALGLFSEVFIAKYDDVSGKLKNFNHGGGDGDDIANCLALNSDNNLTVAGSVHGSIAISVNFGDIIVPSIYENGTDMFIATEYTPYFSAIIEGEVKLNNESHESYIKIYRDNEDSTFSVIYRGKTDASGKYSFTVHKDGKYLVQTDNYKQVKTYYQQTYLWDLAEQLILNKDTPIANIDINILQCDELTGEDSISGRIYSSDGSLKSFIDIILVTKDDSLVSYTQSDTLGYYSFVNVPKGQYKILVDSAGTYMDSYYEIDNSLKSALNGISYENCDYIFEKDHKIYMKTYTLVNQERILSNSIMVFPNPATTYINFYITQEWKNIDIKIYDLSGVCVYESKLNSSTSKIDITSLQNGTYFLKIGDYEIKKIIKLE